MGMNNDFTLAPAHAHNNLLGWVSMAIYGLYFRARRGPSRCGDDAIQAGGGHQWIFPIGIG